MSTEARQPRQQGRRRSSALRSPALNQAQQAPRRRSSAIRRNIETFNRNRAYNIRRGSEQAPPTPRRMTTRSMAREDTGDVENIESTMADIGMDETSEAWQPSLVVGSALWLDHEDPTKIEIADRKVMQTRLLAQNYEGVNAFAEMYERAVQERANLDENSEENITPISQIPSLQAKAVERRIRALHTVLENSTFEPERTNIDAAIAGYESGDITYSDMYTVIWTGRIVDRFPDYESFSNDNRAALLDRYASEYGPGWIWYEPALSKETDLYSGRPTTQAMAAICLGNRESWRTSRNHRNLGHYRLRMAFKRRQEYVSRPKPTKAKKPPYRNPRSYFQRLKDRDEDSSEDDDNNDYKPRMQSFPSANPVVFDTLFDTGATNPCLFSDDIPLLGIDKNFYSAQSVIHLATATGTETAPEYELDVALVDSDFAFSSAIRTPETMSYPLQHPRPMRVSIFPQPSNDFNKSANADPGRLSGLFPFIENYLSSAPGNFKVWLGSSRLDVLGTARLPAEMSFLTTNPNATKKPAFPDPAALKKYQHQLRDCPPTRAIFEHSYAIPSSNLPLILREDETVGKGTTIISGPLPSSGPLTIKFDLDSPSAKRELSKLDLDRASILRIPPQHLSKSQNEDESRSSHGPGTSRKPPPTPVASRKPHPAWVGKAVTLSSPPLPGQKRERRKGSVLERLDRIGASWRQQLMQDPATPSPKTTVSSPRLGKMYNKKGEIIGYVEMAGGGNDDDAEMAGS
ncbi:hypothetical protein QBC40DRAFT_321718 [Triangularia verruculosa]|uniref:Uncharacterized protein n=1 Tax=Triangularia verruculosa TaxID=2587418 RepID=A0AAN6XRI7_9PEZI|nr:hypothetical protein QBC40DRAFT_321718 [Triangularia verruculosa]